MQYHLGWGPRQVNSSPIVLWVLENLGPGGLFGAALVHGENQVRKVWSSFSGASEDIEGLVLSEEDKVEDVTYINGCDEVVDIEDSTF